MSEAIGVALGPLSALTLNALRDALLEAVPPVDDGERIGVLRALEELKATLAALQAEVAVAFDSSQRAEQVARGVPTEQVGRGIAAQVALARRESPHAGGSVAGHGQGPGGRTAPHPAGAAGWLSFGVSGDARGP